MSAAAQLRLLEQPYRFERTGLLALEPRAFFEAYYAPPVPPVNLSIGNIDVVDIRGPLDQHASRYWCDSYEAIGRRVAAACEGPCQTIVLRIDSPGGEAAGCLEAAQGLRAMAEAAGKPLIAYVEGRAHSAAYALACAAKRIVISAASTVGSVGIINTRADVTANDAEHGCRYAVVTSGKRKADGHPHVPISDEEIAATQVLVDSIADVFHELVAEMRGLKPAAVAGLEAGLYHGQAAIAAGLVDGVQSFDALLAELAGGQVKMATKYEDARKALEEAAKGEGDEAKKAKRALAAMDEDEGDDKPKDDGKKAEGEGDKPKDEDKPKDDGKKAEGEGDDEEKPKDDGKKAASGAGDLAALSGRVSKLEEERRTALLASRSDLSPELVKLLETKPVDEVKQYLDAMPKPKVPKPAAAASVGGTRGESQGAPEPSAASTELDLRMGLVPHKLGVRREGNRMLFGVVQAPQSSDSNKEGAK